MKTKLTLIAAISVCIAFFIFNIFQKDLNYQKVAKFDNCDHPNEYAQYHFDIRTLDGEVEPTYPNLYQLKELQKAKLTTKKSSIVNPIFKHRGPYNVPGRTRAIVVDPEDETGNTWIAGSVSGGIWKTTDAGETWININDGMPNMGTTSIVMSESNPNVIYVGTGELSFTTRSVTGCGIFKSTDKGATWNLLESTNLDDIKSITRLVVDPEDENIVLASVVSANSNPLYHDGLSSSSAIIKTIDGGETWTRVHERVAEVRSGAIQQIVADPNDFNNLYAAVKEYGILKSVDKGETWKPFTNGFQNETDRIELAIANQNSHIIYASVYAQTELGNSDLYVSVDTGKTWQIVPDIGGVDGDWLLYQGYYNNTIMVHPYIDTVLYVGGVDLRKLTVSNIENNPTKVTEVVTDYLGYFTGKNSYVHADHHILISILDDDSKFRVLSGTDGGIYKTISSINPGLSNGSWEMAGNGYNTTQFYGVDKKHGSNTYFAGAQDNGTWWSLDVEDPDATTSYEHVIGGDGFEVICHYDDPDKMLGGSQFNGFWKTEDSWETYKDAQKGLDGNLPFISRLAGHRGDPDVVYAYGYGGLFKSDNFADDWHLIPVNNFNWASGYSDIEVSIANSQIVWISPGMSSSNKIFVSTDGGYTIKAVENYDNIGYSTGVVSHPLEDSTAYVLFSVHSKPKVLRTKDLGQTWEDISGFSENSSSTGFPDVAVFSFIVMPFNTSVLWAGTEIGIFESTDNGLSWNIISEFPATTIWDMKIVDDQVVIATYGRGIWSATLNQLQDYEHPVAVKIPSIGKVAQNYFSEENSIVFTLENRDVYDSVSIYIDNELQDIQIPLNEDFVEIKAESSIGEHLIQAIAYKDGIEYKSIAKNVEIIEINEPSSDYSCEFNLSDNDEITGDLFTIRYAAGFMESEALHSIHDYEISSNDICMLKTPLIINQYDSKIEYKDVALIEPGVPNSEPGTYSFYDYVVVEASNNSFDWIAINGPYDATKFPEWEDAYNSGEDASNELYKNHVIDLHDYFNFNDTIIVRFRLYSDGYVVGWGWVVDDFKFNNTNTSVKNEIAKNEVSVYPNPTSSYLNISINQNMKYSKINLININGQLIKSIQPSNNQYEYKIDVRELAKGIYFLKFINAEESISKRVVIN